LELAQSFKCHDEAASLFRCMMLDVGDIPEKGFTSLTLNSPDGGGATMRGIVACDCVNLIEIAVLVTLDFCVSRVRGSGVLDDVLCAVLSR